MKHQITRGQGPTKRNAFAQALALGQYQPKAVANKKAYDRNRDKGCFSD